MILVYAILFLLKYNGNHSSVDMAKSIRCHNSCSIVDAAFAGHSSKATITHVFNISCHIVTLSHVLFIKSITCSFVGFQVICPSASVLYVKSLILSTIFIDRLLSVITLLKSIQKVTLTHDNISAISFIFFSDTVSLPVICYECFHSL